tara:strand:- start:713 stop:985 length:273 start_codon:yes stop_codon:yes gene_type:complete
LLGAFHRLSKLIIIFSAVVSGWTSIVLLSNTTFNLEIKEVINKMYSNQKNFIFNVKELSLLLLKDANERFSEDKRENNQINNNNNNDFSK